MQTKKVGTAILSTAGKSLALVFGLVLLANTALSQSFDNFLFVGIPGIPTGTVTSLSLTDDASTGNSATDIGQVSYFGATGLSSVFTLTATPSGVMNGQTQVYTSANESFASLQLSDLYDIEFYTGELTHETDSVPPNWFRLTRYQGTWSGVFRVGNQVYALDRENATNVVEVRSTLSETLRLSPSLRARVSAVLNASTNGQITQIAALESIHVLDGLLSDSLGMTLLLEQIVIDNVFTANDPGTNLEAAQDIAIGWRQQHQNLFGADDKLATLFFTDQQQADSTTNDTRNSASVNVNNSIILQPHNSEYQFATAHNFGKLLGLSDQTGTLQDWRPAGLVALPAVHWNQQQQAEFKADTPASQFLQVLNNDQPATDATLLPEPEELDRVLVESDSEEREAAIPQNDPGSSAGTATANDANSGGGSAFWLLLISVALFRRSGALAIQRDSSHLE